MNYKHILLSTLCALASSTTYNMKRPLENPFLPSEKKALCMPAKPVLVGYLSLSRQIPSALYGSQAYHVSLCEAGITSYQEYPLLKVHVLVNGKDWTVKTPKKIITYEKKAYEYEQRNDISHDELLKQIVGKTFPTYIPATVLFNTIEGSELQLTIHGYQTKLICSDNVRTRLTFDRQYNKYLKHFSSSPLLMPSPSQAIHEQTETELKDKELLIVSYLDDSTVPTYECGPKGFTTIENLLIQEKIGRNVTCHKAIMNRQFLGNKKRYTRITQQQQEPQ